MWSKKWRYRTRGRTLDLIPNPGFSRKYVNEMNQMVEHRFKSSVNAITSFWHTVEVYAGSPQIVFETTRESNNVFQDFLLKLEELWLDVNTWHQQRRDKLQL